MNRRTGTMGAAALVTCLAATGCARPERERPESAAQPTARTQTAAPDTTPKIAPPSRPLDTRPWVPEMNPLPAAPAPAAPAPARAPAQGTRGQGTTGETGAWTARAVERRPAAAEAATLRAIRTGAHTGWDRVVFEFAEGRIPPYRVEYVDRPIHRCGSGDVTQVAGQGWLQVRLSPARAHTEAGAATITQRERRLSLGVLRELEITCDFEAEVVVVLGAAAPNRFRVTEMSGPARLVVDVRR